jgi:hypothetical protein
MKDIPEPWPPHDKKGKRKVDEGNIDFQETNKTVNVMFGGLPTRRSQKLTLREVFNIEPAVLLMVNFRQPRVLVIHWF